MQSIGIAYNPSVLSREYLKGLQENAVGLFKRTLAWLLRIWSYDRADDCWHVAATAVPQVINTRMCTNTGSIPYHLVHESRPRMDLIPLGTVYLIRNSRVLANEREESVIFLQQIDPLHALVWPFASHRATFIKVAIDQLRSTKIPATNFIAMMPPPPAIGALSTTSRVLKRGERSSPEFL